MDLDRAQPGGEPGASSTSKAPAAGTEPGPASTVNGHTAPVTRSQQPEWEDPGEPDAEELRGMTAYDGGIEQFRERLGSLAKTHWDRTQTVKEGETIVNFAYAIRMRSGSLPLSSPLQPAHSWRARLMISSRCISTTRQDTQICSSTLI